MEVMIFILVSLTLQFLNFLYPLSIVFAIFIHKLINIIFIQNLHTEKLTDGDRHNLLNRYPRIGYNFRGDRGQLNEKLIGRVLWPFHQ